MNALGNRYVLRALFFAVFSVWSGAFLLAQGSEAFSPEALSQIQALVAEKRGRTPAQRKVDSNLLYEAKQRRGLAVANGVPPLQTGIPVSDRGTVIVDITAKVTDSFLEALASVEGRVLYSNASYRSVRAELPLAAVESLAAHPDVLFVNSKQEAMVNGEIRPQISAVAGVTPSLLRTLRPGFAARAAAVRSKLAAALKAMGRGVSGARPEAIAKINTSEGDVTHRANLARATFGADGTGVKVGVLSDGVNSLTSLQSSGDLPPVVTVLPGQAGSGDEGSAILEIVYDLAPGSSLYFATAFNGIASFAQNIKDLRTAGCDVIIDDVTYFAETPFQEGQAPSVASTTNGGLVIQAVNDVTAAGALYFSSAANSGGKDKGTSGTWEGDFVDGGAAGSPIPEAGRLHDFDPTVTITTYNATTAGTGAFPSLFWSDPLGGSANDYDLFILNSTGSSVLGASTNTQNGTQDPIEIINFSPLSTGLRIVILKFSGAARFLHLDTNRGRLTFNTPGSTRGHNAPPAANSFSVAATPAVFPGPYPNPFNSSNHIETFSSDGPRQYFYFADSSAITPGNVSSTGGVILQKPDVTAADGVSVATPGFNPFYGTSAAAPHAGAIAALVKSRNPSLTASQIATILRTTTIDIEAAGWDRDSGFGILDAYNAVQAAGVAAGANFFTVTPCRVLDTRNPEGPFGGPSLVGGTTRTFVLVGQCSLPSGAQAVAVNVAETNAEGSGHLRIFAGGTSLPNVAAINFGAGQTRSNNAIVSLGSFGDVSVYAGIGAGLHVDIILDVVGYFAP
jgi:Subtilase family